jgi:ADP-heptose:LPS heptosyltransferase
VTLLVRTPIHGALLAGHPAVDEILSLGRGRGTLRRLRRPRFDRSITAFPANDWRFEAITRWIAARQRLGHAYPLHRWPRVPGAYTRRIPVEEVDDVQQNLNLVAPGLVPRPPRMTLKPVVASGPVLGIHPGSSRARRMALKRWPAAYFHALIARALEAVPGLGVWVFAGPAEEEEAAAVAAGLGPRVEVVRGLPLPEVAARIAACTAFLANDSGLMHVAAACGVPTVALFGPTDPLRTSPRGAGHTVLRSDAPCAPCWPLADTGRRPACYQRQRICLEGIAPATVWAALEPMLGIAAGGAAP